MPQGCSGMMGPVGAESIVRRATDMNGWPEAESIRGEEEDRMIAREDLSPQVHERRKGHKGFRRCKKFI